jgi:L-fucose isomerase-like protein
MIEDRDKLIYEYRLRDLSEEEKQKLSWKERQERMDKYKKIDQVIDELFTEEAISVQKVEPHYIVN